jgi:hypothetical protein
MKNLSIPNPCPVNWDSMTPNESGRFCDQCQLTVVDFTAMTESEIKNYFQCNYGKKTCGRFKVNQLDHSTNKTTLFWPTLHHKIQLQSHQSPLKTYLLGILAILAFITGCSRKPVYHMMGDIQMTGEPVYIEKMDTIKTTPVQQNPSK